MGKKSTSKNNTAAIYFAFLVFFCQSISAAYAAQTDDVGNKSAFGFSSQTPSQKSAQKFQLAIIIDDIGAKGGDVRAFELPKTITFSILPHTQFSTKFSYLAAQQNREVMLHMPMESLGKENLGPGPLLASMYPEQIKTALLNALKTVPHAVGVNNHMGSKLTQMTLQMTTFMNALQANNMFFIDSRTTRFTKASLIARQQGVKVASRHVFLDHIQQKSFLTKQFRAAVERARAQEKAILIAHPYPITLEFLQKELADLPKDIELITVSRYLQETDKFRINPQLVMRSNISIPIDESTISAPYE